MTTSELLRAARALIDKPQKWCKRYDFLHGRHCARGALLEVTDGLDRSGFLLHRTVSLLERATPGDRLMNYNDRHTHAEVMALFDRAIALAEKGDA